MNTQLDRQAILGQKSHDIFQAKPESNKTAIQSAESATLKNLEATESGIRLVEVFLYRWVLRPQLKVERVSDDLY